MLSHPPNEKKFLKDLNMMNPLINLKIMEKKKNDLEGLIKIVKGFDSV